MPTGKTTRRLRWAIVLAGVAVVLLVAVTGWQALRAKSALELVADDFETLSGQLTSGDREAAGVTLAHAQKHAAAARANTRGPGWWLTSRIPGVGPNVDAVRTVAEVVDTLATDVLPPVVDAAATLTPERLRPSGGRIALEPIIDVAPSVVAADAIMQRQEQRVADLDTDGLAPEIGRPVSTLKLKLAEAATLSDRASRAVRLLPPMLGAEGRRSYLLLFQNNAELRATGGIPGSFATIVADNGRIRLGQQGDAQTIGRFDKPPIALTADEKELFGENLGRYPQDVNFTPDFPRSAEIIRAMWNARHGGKVDGVISVDPIALSYVLRGTGPVSLPAGRSISADNAVRMLLSDVYAEIPNPAEQNIWFNAVAGRVFEALTSGQGDPQKVLQGVTQAGVERRILVWSADPAEEALVERTSLGAAVQQVSGREPRVGVFLNDGTGAKMDYYLHHSVDVTPLRCEGARQVLEVTLTLDSDAPPRGAGLPDYVAKSFVGVPRGTIRTTVLGYAPVQGYIDETSLDGQTIELTRLRHGNRVLVRTTVDVKPGQRRTLRWLMVSGAGQSGPVHLRTTPGVHETGVGTVGAPVCPQVDSLS